MKRTFLLLTILSLLVHGCAFKKDAVQGITAATPKIPEAADASRWPEEPPEEDASAWPGQALPDEDDRTSRTISASGAGPYIEAYTDKKSYLPGETINFHVSTTAATYSIEIREQKWERKAIAKVSDLPGAYHPAPPYEERPWAEGANWPVSYSWVVPDEWENGSYLAMLRTTSGEYTYTYHPFIVRTRVPGSRSKVAFVMNYNTRNAYNRWGGKSLYWSGFWGWGDRHYAVAVSFLRPVKPSYGRGDGYWCQWEVSSQLQADEFNPEFITEWDISTNPVIVRAYDVLVFAGHHEYISRNTYDAIEAHHRRGGHLAFFSANDIYWQVRFEDNGDKMVSYKGYAWNEDPVMGVDDSLVTNLWRRPPVNRPPEALRGICYVPYSYLFEPEDFIVQHPNHFMFEGTGLQSGDAFGSKIATGETDYVGPNSPPTMDIALLTRREQVRNLYERYAKVDHVDAAAVYYEESPQYGFPDGRGGQVFSAGTHYGWGSALLSSSSGYEAVRRVTRNIIQHMVDAPPPPPDFQDLGALVSYWLDECGSPGWCEYADLDMNGAVDLTDFAHLARYWPGN